MNHLVFIQARMKSSRFPGKVLAPLHGKPVIQHVIDRVGGGVDKSMIVVVTTTHHSDDPLVAYLKNKGIASFRGPEDDVLARFYHAARGYDKPEWIARVTADCPLLDPRMFLAVERYSPYWGRTNSPDGNDLEAFTFSALEDSWKRAGLTEREHVTTWMRAHLECDSVEADPAYADVHYSVNTVEDLRVCEQLIAACGEGARWQDYVDAYRRLDD